MYRLTTGEVIVMIALTMGAGAWVSNSDALAFVGFWFAVIGVALVIKQGPRR